MNIRHQIKTSSLKAVTALAIAIGAIGAVNIAVTAAPAKGNVKSLGEDNWRETPLQLAQVGIRSRINAPTPLNLRPRSHTPLPRSNYYRPSRRYRRYQRNRRDYGYYDRHHHGYRNHRYYGDRHERRRYNTRYKRRSNRGKVIILNAPGSFKGYGDRNSYIRIIGR